MRICSGPGCGRKVADDVRFCAECLEERGGNDGRLSRVERAANDPIMLEYGGKRWQVVRRLGIKRFPFCPGFAGENCNQVAVVGDHNIPARLLVRVCRALKLFPFEKWPGFYISANVIGLCHKHHNMKTRVEDSMDWREQCVVLLSRFMPKELTDEEKRARVRQAYESVV